VSFLHSSIGNFGFHFFIYFSLIDN
jgi:hypothetical protein